MVSPDFAGLIDRILSQRGHYGRLYDEATQPEGLLVRASEAVCIAAADVLAPLPLPRRGRLVLALMRTLTPERYRSYRNSTEGPFAQSLVAAGGKFAEELVGMGLSEAGSSIVKEHVITWGAATYQDIIRMSANERAEFTSRLAAAYRAELVRPAKDDAERLTRLLGALQRKPAASAGAASLMNLVNSARLTEPYGFLKNWMRLRA